MKTNRLTLFLLGCLLLSVTISARASGKYICVEDSQVGVKCYKCFCKLPTQKTDWHLYASRVGLQTDLLHANLVSEATDRLRKKLGASGSISLTNTDFTAFASPGKTELTYTSESKQVKFDMVIGQPDLVNSQTWTLPADLTNQLNVVEQRNFISPASIPASLQLAGVTHATKFVAPNRLFTGYRQYQITGAAVNSLGSSVDRKVGADYSTATPNALFSVLPLQLSSAYTSQTIYDTPDDDIQTQQTDTLAFDGFGGLKTPNGTFQALRYTIKTGIRTYDLSGGGPPSNGNLIDIEYNKHVGWVTKEGYWILADCTGYNPATKAATLSNVQYTAIVPTSSLSPTFTGSPCNCNR